MQVINQITVGDIINYEITNSIDVRKQLRQGEFFVVIDFISIGNNYSIEEAIDKFKRLRNEYSYEEIVQELAREMFSSNSESDSEVVEDNDKSLTEILTDFYNEIQTFDDSLSISEFMNMNTSFMYKYAEGIKSRYIFNKNKELRDEFDNIAMLMSAFDGNLKKAPQIKEQDLKTAKQIKEERIQELRARRQERIERGEI